MGGLELGKGRRAWRAGVEVEEKCVVEDEEGKRKE